MMNVIMSTLEAAPSDSERMHLLNTLPAPQGIRVIMGLSTLSPEVDAFKMLKPIAKKMDAMQRKFFITFSKMSDAEVEKEIKEDQAEKRREGTAITAENDLLRLPPYERKRKFVAGFLAMAGMMGESGEMLGESDDDDEFDFDSDGDSDSSDSSSDDVDPASLSPTESKLKAVLAALEQEDLKVMFLARPYDQAKAKPKDITVAKVLAVEHLMLPAPTVDVAQRLAKRASKMVFGWPGGATSCGNAVWGRFLRPALAEAQAAIARRDSAAALGPLLGVVLIGCSDDGWLRDQEEYCEWDAFAQWFADVSKAWQKVLAEPDGALGLAPARGRKELGHYRGVLMRVLTKWEEEVNETLDEVFDEFKEGGKKAKLSATEKPKAKPPLKGKGKAAVAPSSASSSSKRRRGQ
jgi:hypothetical protein